MKHCFGLLTALIFVVSCSREGDDCRGCAAVIIRPTVHLSKSDLDVLELIVGSNVEKARLSRIMRKSNLLGQVDEIRIEMKDSPEAAEGVKADAVSLSSAIKKFGLETKVDVTTSP